VLGAGGNAAIAWEIGIIAGLADAGIDVRDADVLIGTSAGSIVATLLASGLPLEHLFAAQFDPAKQPDETAPRTDFAKWRADLLRAKATAADGREFLRRVGALASAREEHRPLKADRQRIIASRLAIRTWPDTRVLIVAVDAESGERCVFDRTSGAPLVDAVAASCAVAGIWPAVEIDGRRYIDGGFYSIDNADLAAGYDGVLIVTLPARVPPLCILSLDEAVRGLRDGGARVAIVHPDEPTQAAFASVGGNLLDPAVRTPAARAGREQGRVLANDDSVRRAWNVLTLPACLRHP
jgi:NTE family protein